MDSYKLHLIDDDFLLWHFELLGRLRCLISDLPSQFSNGTGSLDFKASLEWCLKDDYVGGLTTTSNRSVASDAKITWCTFRLCILSLSHKKLINFASRMIFGCAWRSYSIEISQNPRGTTQYFPFASILKETKNLQFLDVSN